MTDTLSFPLSKPGSWALEVERAEEELQRQQETEIFANQLSAEFPSLAAASITRKSKKKKKTSLTISLSDFLNDPSLTVLPVESNCLTYDELHRLPTRPRERSECEFDRNHDGVGFTSVRANGQHCDELYHSQRDRADEDWRDRKSSAAVNRNARQKDHRFYESRGIADESDGWGWNRPVESRSFGGGSERRTGSFDSTSRNGPWFRSNRASSDSDNWRKKEDGAAEPTDACARPKLHLSPPSSSACSQTAMKEDKQKKQSPFGNARPREEVLAEKGIDWKKLDADLDCLKIGHGVDAWRKTGPCPVSPSCSDLTEDSECAIEARS